MRRRRLIGATAAAAVLAGSVIAGGTTAFAETPTTLGAFDGAPPAADTGTVPVAVTLPTGDRVTLLPNGTHAIESAPGRENASFITPPSPGGDTVVVPTDRVAAIEAGEEDPRRYNVTELLKAGQADAAAATESELDDRAYAGLIPDASRAPTMAAEEDLQRLSVTLRDRSGEAPDGHWMVWSARDGSDYGDIPIEENGEGGIALPPGDYIIVSGFWSDATETERGQTIVGMTPLTIEDTGYDLLLDGNAGHEVSVDVERDADLLNAVLVVEAHSAGANLGYGHYLGPRDDAYLLPQPDLPEFELGFLFQPVLASPASAEEPYVYNLAFHDAERFPEETAYSVADEDLATVDADYRDLGTPYEGRTCDYGDYTGRQIGHGLCRLVDTAVPSQRIMYYTADPEISWDKGLWAVEISEDGDFLNGFIATHTQIFEPGRSERVMPKGALSAGVPLAARWDHEGVDFISAEIAPLGGANDEHLVIIGAKADAELSRDGTTLASIEGVDFYRDDLYTDLPEGDAGRYTLTADITQPSSGSIFGTDASFEWRFDSVALDEGESQDIVLPVVQFSADDVEAGYGERDGCQEITLDMRSYEHGPVTQAEAMTFEVSYNDGRTWRKVRIHRDGNTATAELDHPRGAKWVSVRMTARDDAGTEVEHTMIRAYGLK